MKKKETFCPGCHNRDKRAPPFVPDWRSRLGNRDNSGFPTGTNHRFCSSVHYYLCVIFKLVSPNSCMKIHYYKNVDLSRLGTPVVLVSQPGTPVRDKKGVPFCPGCGNRDKRSLFFSCFSFLNSFSISIILLHFN